MQNSKPRSLELNIMHGVARSGLPRGGLRFERAGARQFLTVCQKELN